MVSKALVLGCGNIGALYDFGKEDVLTHAKAYSLIPGLELHLFDHDEALLRRVSEYYGAFAVTDIGSVSLQEFRFVSICTPTVTHFHYLSLCLKAGVPVIICEKPISLSVEELAGLGHMRKQSRSLVFVNYFRRFQPAFNRLKTFMDGLDDTVSHIAVTYQRGFLNNASHAFDLLGFLYGKTQVTDVRISSREYDEFETDATISLSARLNGAPLSLTGLAYARYSFFDIRIFYQSHLVHIADSGSEITIFRAGTRSGTFYTPLRDVVFHETGCIKNHMSNVIGHITGIAAGLPTTDNFDESLELNLSLLKIPDTDGKTGN